MHCHNCGKEIDDKAVVCIGCGVAVKPIKPQEKKLSGLQIAAYILFGLQLFALIGLGAQYDLGTVFYVLGYFSLTIVGVICLVVDNNKKTKGVVSEPKEPLTKEEIILTSKKPKSYYLFIVFSILFAVVFISFVIVLILYFVKGAEYSNIPSAVIDILGFTSLGLFIALFIVSAYDRQRQGKQSE